MEGEHYFCSPSIVETLYLKETKMEEFDDNKKVTEIINITYNEKAN
jgi:hypothetical protein